MKRQLQGIGLILFSLLFYHFIDALHDYLFYVFGIGVSVPWDIIAFLMGLVGLIMVFAKDKNNT